VLGPDGVEADAEQQLGGEVNVARALGADQQGRRVAGAGHRGVPRAVTGLETSEQAGGDRRDGEVTQSCVEPAEEQAQRVVAVDGEGAEHTARLGHRRGSIGAVPGNIPDDEQHRAGRQRNRVVPVPAHLGGLHSRDVAGGDLQWRHVGQLCEHAALQDEGHLGLPLVAVRLQAAGAQPASDVVRAFGLTRGGQGDRGLGREQPGDDGAVVGERARPHRVEVERAEGVLGEEQPDRQHAAHAGLLRRARGKLRPPVLLAEVTDPEGRRSLS